MDLKGAIEFLESYLRGYVLYLLQIFSSSGNDAESDDVTDPSSKLATYALISVTVGVALQGVFIQGKQFSGIDFSQRTVLEVCFWLALTFLAHAVLTLLKKAKSFSDTLSAILRVLPPAFVAGAFCASVAYELDWFRERASAVDNYFAYDNAARMTASVTDAIIQIVLVVAFLPRSMRRAAENGASRSIWATACVILILVGADFAIVFTPPPLCPPSKEDMKKHPGGVLCSTTPPKEQS